MATKYRNKDNVPAIKMDSFEVAGILDHFPYCDLCEEQSAQFIVFPGVNNSTLVYCPICARAYAKSACLSKIERRKALVAYDKLVEILFGHALWF